ncbi:MAG: protein translocase subunit SecD, partial [Dehalococcoidia bacterium]|nr:protein translocase subunit SecD [Dehalococcoidia bacterium]
LALMGLSLWVILPTDSTRLGKTGFQFGLDIKGGTRLVYEADLSKKDDSLSNDEVMASLLDKISRRANTYSTEPIIQKYADDRILVELPGVKDTEEAIGILGSVAILEICEEDGIGSSIRTDNEGKQWFVAVGNDGTTELTGKYLKSARVGLDPNNNPVVVFEWNDEGAKLFEEITGSNRNLYKPIAIFLDGEIISKATVQATISSPGTISGMTTPECTNLAIKLNSGSLDVPLTIVQQTKVDATLGADSLNKSLIAGAIGVGIIVAFMIFYYGIPGAIAAFALLIYSVIVLAIYKLLPVTITMPSIAGFVISIGMAVDANVLIFERLKEELRSGRSLHSAISEAFRRAWPSIRDSNISTFITCAILYWFGNAFGAYMVRGFALTLFIGVLVSMFSAVLITRTFIDILIGEGFIKGLSIHEVKKNV